MDIVFFVGSVAAVMTTMAFMPQVIKAHKTKHTKDLSLMMYVLLSIGLVLWTTYGVMLRELPIILANLFTLVLTFYILYLKVRNG